ncbi:hypothetical protein IZY60_03860 [Lutibacter sp. B2]|nr:hypothetical protein [Lutibacter sp. B2]
MSKVSNEATNKKIKRIFRLKNKKWVILISIWTFFFAIIMTFISNMLLKNVNLIIAFLILMIIILIGIISDLIGIAVTAAREKPFHSMAAKKIEGARFAVKLVRNAGEVSNFCSDVIGDICGIVSGATGAILVVKFSKISSIPTSILSIFLGGFIASITVGGKAIGKEIALKNSKEIVFYVGKSLYHIHKKLGINFLSK